MMKKDNFGSVGKENIQVKVPCLEQHEELYLVGKGSREYVDIYLRHMIEGEEDEASMIVSVEITELEKAIVHFRKVGIR